MKQDRFRVSMLSGLLVVAGVLTGICNSGCASKSADGGRQVASDQQAQTDAKQREIDRIKNDVKMPEKAKTAALEGMKRGEAAQQMALRMQGKQP